MDGVLEENLLELYFVAGVLFISEVEPLDVNITRRPQTDAISGIFVLDYYIYISIYIYLSILSSVFILTQCALIYWCLITFFTLSVQDSILNEHLIMIMFISIFIVNLSYNDILFCLFKISFVCWQWFFFRDIILNSNSYLDN